MSNISKLFGYENSKITEAVVLGYKGYFHIDSDIGAAWSSYHPVVEYYNEFLNEKVTKQIVGSGFDYDVNHNKKNESHDTQCKVEAGEKVKIEYTKKRVRVIDERFIKHNRYNVLRYIIPPIIGLFVVLLSFVLLIISIL